MSSIHESSQSLPRLFNGLIEVAFRQALISEVFLEHELTIEHLRLLDFFTVHLGDVGGPVFLHPKRSNRIGFYDCREEAVKASAKLLTTLKMSNAREIEGEVRYTANETAVYLEGITSTDYMKLVHHSADYLRSQMEEADSFEAFITRLENRLSEIRELVDVYEGNWRDMEQNYRSDLMRLEFIEEGAWLFPYLIKQHTHHEPDNLLSAKDIADLPRSEWFQSINAEATKEIAKTKWLLNDVISLKASVPEGEDFSDDL